MHEFSRRGTSGPCSGTCQRHGAVTARGGEEARGHHPGLATDNGETEEAAGTVGHSPPARLKERDVAGVRTPRVRVRRAPGSRRPVSLAVKVKHTRGRPKLPHQLPLPLPLPGGDPGAQRAWGSRTPGTEVGGAPRGPAAAERPRARLVSRREEAACAVLGHPAPATALSAQPGLSSSPKERAHAACPRALGSPRGAALPPLCPATRSASPHCSEVTAQALAATLRPGHQRLPGVSSDGLPSRPR
ncbi:uncharacterized protein LOC125103859 [Lutra lutra]|uniref:uncharacterized protein LOC125103859 n=1 Tax=Lutra lutra TaxID=9657 RepID=UPI001FD38C17|nr:uncharacterized protein LOC125103859 [Lutra lutra]XP_047591733.1 uncharacterized protein LOC125103859 [Lutra lutra]XP_047591734.1 uncharacterized protein LOC125103859 [Lutra lutra]